MDDRDIWIAQLRADLAMADRTIEKLEKAATAAEEYRLEEVDAWMQALTEKEALHARIAELEKALREALDALLPKEP